MMESLIEIIAVLSVFVLAPGIVFGFVYKNKKNKIDLQKMQYQKEILELELEKERTQLKLLEAENTKYDNIINNDGYR
jgi:Na+-translocating ferredoxin:NAD+ oxidoreductase RnfG subunit